MQNIPKIRVGLFGFGRAGKAVASVFSNTENIEFCWVIRKSPSKHGLFVNDLLGMDCESKAKIHSLCETSIDEVFAAEPVDVIVDFSSREGIHAYRALAERRAVTVISAISSYDEEDLAALEECATKTRVIYSPNITVGVNFLMIASRILKNIAPDVDIEIIEEHFKDKREVSGTAKILAGKLGIREESIKSVRAGGIIGVHRVVFGFPWQTVRLTHESIAREAFGKGALFIIDNLPDAATGLFNMEDILRPFFRLEDRSDAGNGRIPWWKFWHAGMPLWRLAG